jgi:hypothetical protein
MIGGGLDLNLNRHFAVRLFRADFVYSDHQFGPSSVVPATDVRGVRLQAGVVFMFGGGQPGPPVSASCTVNPSAVMVGEPTTTPGAALAARLPARIVLRALTPMAWRAAATRLRPISPIPR